MNFTDKQLGFMKRAVELAQANIAKGGGPFGAVIVRRGSIISEGFNQVTPLNDPTAHAEVQAIRNACKALGSFDLSGCDLYTSCEPCPMCLGAIYWARPDRVFYSLTRKDAEKAGFDDNLIYHEINIDPEKRKIPMKRLDHPEAPEVFRAWSEFADKTAY